jgi:receptor protein-tyrosine kinase
MPVVGVVLSGAVALGVCLLLTPQYESSMRLFVSANESASADAVEGNQLAQDRVASYAELITGRDLARRVIARLDLQSTPKELSEQISAEAEVGTVLITVVVTDQSPERALGIALAVAEESIADVERLETADAGVSPIRVSVAEPPQLPVEPSSPKTARNVVIAGVLGLLVGAVVALMRPVLDRSVRTPEQAAELVGAPAIGLVRRDRSLRAGRGGRAPDRLNPAAREDFRRIRANLQFMDVGRSPTVLMVSSAVPSEGKTTLAVNLGLVLAEAGRTVTVVEANLRSPAVARRLGISGDPGLAQILAGVADVDDVVQCHVQGELWVLPAGPAPDDPTKLLESGDLPSLLEKLRGRNDVVLVEGPSLLAAADTSELAQCTDGVVLAVRHGRTRREQLDQGAAILDFAHARLLGVVLTMAPPSSGPGVSARPGRAADRHYRQP